MNHAFLLKHYGNLSIEEQDNMTFEDRKWWLNRTKEEIDKKNSAAAASDRTPSHRDHTPGQPPV
jgi:hypothetical protein